MVAAQRSFFTCNGEVVVGIACDKTLVSDHKTIVDGFAVTFDWLLAATPGVTRERPVPFGEAAIVHG